MKDPFLENEEIPILTIIQDIKDKRLHPKTLSKDARQQCVAALFVEGLTPSEMAQIFSCCDRTIRRDIDDIYEAKAPKSDPKIIKRIVGGMIQKSEMYQAHLMRISRKKDGSLAAKYQATFMAWRIEKETVQMLQSLGYLGHVKKDVSGVNEDVISLDELKERMDSTQTVAAENGTLTPEIQEKLKCLTNKIARLQLENECKALENEVSEVNDESNPSV